MNPEAQEFLNKILQKSPRELIPAERAFLRARRSYLKPAQEKEYEEILNMDEVVDIEGNIVVKKEAKSVKPTKKAK